MIEEAAPSRLSFRFNLRSCVVAACVLLVFSLAAAMPAAAQDLSLDIPAVSVGDVLVSNLDQPATTGSRASLISDGGVAQVFTTGTNGEGYDLGYIELAFEEFLADTSSLSVSLWTTTTNSHPDQKVVDLTRNGALTLTSTTRFDAPADTVLEAETSFAVVMQGSDDDFHVRRILPETSPDETSDFGFNLDDLHLAFDGVGGIWRVFNEESYTPIMMRVIGTEKGSSTNATPTLDNEIPDQTATAGVAFSYQFPADTFEDPDGDDLTYTTGTLPGWLSFDAATRTFSGTPVAVGEFDITVTAADPGGLSVEDGFTISVVTIPAVTTDDVLVVSLSGPSSAVTEGTGLTFTLTLNEAAPAGGLSVVVSVAETGDVVAASGEGSQTVMIAAAATQAEFTVATEDDGEDEAASEVTVTLVADSATPATYTLGTPAAATATVNDNDLPIVTFSTVERTVTEGETVTFQLQRRGDLSVALTVSVGVSQNINGRFISGTAPSSVTFAEGQATTTLSVATDDDAVDEANGWVVLQVLQTSNPQIRLEGPLGLTSQLSARVNVRDNDTRGVTVTGSPVAVSEGSTATYTLVLDSEPTADVTITPTSGDADAVTVSPATLTFTPTNWQTAQTVTVTGVADTDTDNESVTITHGAVGGDYEPLTVADVTVTVTDTTPSTAVDTEAPTILSIERLDPTESLTNAVRLTWRITFSEPVRNVNQSTIVISELTNPMLELTKVGEEDRIWEVTASGGNIADVDGLILLSFAATFGSNIEDMAGNELNQEENPVPNENSYQLDRNAPTVTFIQRLVPTGISTNADQVVWLVRFSEEVKNVDAADFQVSGTSATLAVNRDRGTSDATWEVRASGGDLADYNGTVRLSFASNQNIQDRAGNALSNTAPTTNLIETIFELDNLPPTVAIQNVPGTSQGPFTATIRFSEAVQDFFREDIVANNATLSAFTATVADQEWTVQVTPTTDGEVTLDIAADAARDGAGNGNTAATQASSDYTAPAVDTTAPGVVSIERQDPAPILTNADSLTWRVIFTEVVMPLEAEDFTLDGTTAELAVEVNPNPGVWDITASGGNLATLDGRVTLAFASDQNITDLAGLALQDLQPTGANEISYDLDNTAPMVTWTLPTALEIDLDFLLFRPQTTDTDIISYRATDLPAGLTVNERTGAILGTLTTVSDAITSTVTVTDEAGNMASTVLEFPAIAADTTPPRVTSIQRLFPASSPTSNRSSLNWSVEFSVAVDNVDRSDFTVQPTPGSFLVSKESNSNSRIYTVSAIDNYQNTDLTATLEFASDQDITDRAGNLLTDTVPTGANDNFFVIDNTRPAVEITDVPPQSDAPFTATITFSETVTGFIQEDITAGNATLSDFTAVDTAETPAGTTWTVRVTPDADGSVTLDIAANVAVDQVNQGNTAATQATSAYSSLFQVRGVTLTPQIHELEVRWEVATGAAGYIVQWKSGTQDYDSAREWRTTDPTITRRDLTQLDGNTEYTVRVIPFTGSSPNEVLGVPSAEVMATPLKPTPVILFTDDGGGEPITQDINGLVAARIQFFQSAQGIEVEDFVVTNGELVPGSLNFVRGNTRNVTINVVVTAQEGELFTFTVLEDVIENGNHAATFSQAAGRPLTATITTNARQPVTSNFSTTFTFSENVRGEGGSVEPIDGLFIPESAVPGSNLASFNCCTYTNVSYVSRGAVTIDGQRTFTVNFRPRGNFEGEGRIYLIPGRVQDDATKSIRNLPAELRVQIDTKSPELQSMAVEGTGIVFTFHEDLDPGSVPAADAFTVTVDGAAASLAATDPVLVSGPTLTLTLAERVVGGQVLRVRYAKGSRPLQDLPSNDVANFTRQVTVPPVLAVASTPMLLSLGTAEADTYGEGDAIQVTATFAETVAVTGTPAISLDIGGTTRTATYESGTGTDTLRFSSTVTASDLDADGISWQANALALAGGAITGEDGQAVDIAHVLQGALAAHKVDGSQQGGATITDIRMSSTPVADAIYRADEVIRFTADFSGPVLVSGVPTLAFTLGDTVQQAAAVDVSEVAVDELTFIYTVTASDQDLDGISWEADPITLPDDATIIGPDITAPADLSYQAHGPLSEHTVRGGNVLATGAPTITGTAQSGQTLTAGQGDLADPDDLPTTFPDDYTFQWVRENEDGTGTEDITGATSATYLLNTDDVGRKVWVRVTFTDGQGNTEARESARFPVAGTVVAANSAPTVANQIPNQSATVGTAFSFTIPANTFDDADGDPLDYAATLADSNPLPAWLDFDPATREFSGTPTSAETITVRVSVTDAESESASEDFDIVVSPAVDTAAPSFDSATVDGTTMTITFDEALDDTSTPAADAFTVLADATAVMVSTAAVSGSTVTLTLATAVTAGQTVTVAYTKPDTGSVLQDASSNETATFAARTVENTTAETTPPPSTGSILVSNDSADSSYVNFDGGGILPSRLWPQSGSRWMQSSCTLPACRSRPDGP